MANIFNDSIQGVKLLIEVVKIAKKELKELVNISKKVVKEMKFKTSKDCKNLDKEIKQVTTARKDLINIEKQEITLQSQIKKLTDEEVQAKIIHQKETKAPSDRIKKLILIIFISSFIFI